MESVISVVIPVYNSEKYLPVCMDSILNQTYQQLQVIAIDDGSKDNSLQILNDYAKRDGRILVVHQENKGAAAARNVGIKHATGDWIVFVDSDDKIKSEYCWKMLNAAVNLDAEIVIENPSTNEENLYTNEQKEKLICSCLAFDETSFPYNIDAPWGKIFDAKLLKMNSIIFPEDLKRSEDAYFCMNSYYWAKNIGYTNCSDYQYLVRNDSLSKSYHKDAQEILEKILEINYRWIQINGNHNPKFEKALWFRVLPGIVECENYYFLHEKYQANEACKSKEYSNFLKQPMVRKAIKKLKIKDIRKRQYKIRLIFYKMNLEKIFIKLKRRLY